MKIKIILLLSVAFNINNVFGQNTFKATINKPYPSQSKFLVPELDPENNGAALAPSTDLSPVGSAIHKMI